jgi:hypothetical protein
VLSAECTGKTAFWAKYNGEKMHLGQNIMEKILEVSAKYSQKNAFWAKYDGKKMHLTSHENADGIETEILHNTDTVLSHIFVHLAELNIAAVLWRLVRLPHLLVDKS